MMSNVSDKQEFYWHESAGVRILLPSQLVINKPFPELCATSEEDLTYIRVLMCPFGQPQLRKFADL
jgi:hypothetical protein